MTCFYWIISSDTDFCVLDTLVIFFQRSQLSIIEMIFLFFHVQNLMWYCREGGLRISDI